MHDVLDNLLAMKCVHRNGVEMTQREKAERILAELVKDGPSEHMEYERRRRSMIDEILSRLKAGIV